MPEAWCQLSDSLHTADSLLDQAMDVHIEDLYNRPMNPRMVMFDACYNGSFHLDECIAASYIFGPGDCIVTQGNSVNALQDKWPDRYIGLLDCGVRIGQWGRHVHYLETHLIGDPTYRFINRALPGTGKHGTHGKSIGQQILAPDGRRNDARRRCRPSPCASWPTTVTTRPPTCVKKRIAESPYGPVRLEAPQAE